MLVVGIRRGQVVDVGDRWLAICCTVAKTGLTIITNEGTSLSISSHRLKEVFPGFRVGLSPERKLRLLIDAPRSMRVSQRPITTSP